MKLTEYDTFDEMVDYSVDYLRLHKNSIFITEYNTALQLVDELEDVCIEPDIIDKCDEDTEPDTIVYVTNMGKDVFLIEDIFDEDGDIADGLGADYVLIQDGLLFNEIIDEYIYAEEEMELVDYKEDKEDSDFDEEYNPCENCERCCCECDEDEEESPYDQLTDAEQELIDEYVENSGYSEEILSEIYLAGKLNGTRDILYGLSETYEDIAENI